MTPVPGSTKKASRLVWDCPRIWPLLPSSLGIRGWGACVQACMQPVIPSKQRAQSRAPPGAACAKASVGLCRLVSGGRGPATERALPCKLAVTGPSQRVACAEIPDCLQASGGCGPASARAFQCELVCRYLSSHLACAVIPIFWLTHQWRTWSCRVMCLSVQAGAHGFIPTCGCATILPLASLTVPIRSRTWPMLLASLQSWHVWFRPHLRLLMHS